MPFLKSALHALKYFKFPALLCFGLSACSEPATNESPQLEVTSSSQLLSIQKRIETLSNEIENSEAIADIKRLQWAYGHYSELGLWHDFADLFSENAVGHYPAGDLNRDEIRSLFVDQVGQGQLGLSEGGLYPHISFTPVVNLSEDGQSAKARFRILAMLGGYGGNATWAHGVYENGYVKEDGIWKVSELGYHGEVSGRYGETLTSTLNTPLTQSTVPFSYYPEQIGRIKNPLTQSSSQASPKSLGNLISDYSTLEQKLERLNAETIVSNLQHQFGFFMDSKQWGDVASLFAENGSMELGLQGVYLGQESIREGLNRFGPQDLANGELRRDLQFQTYISISEDAQHAKARITQLGMHGSDNALDEWREGIYENDYVRENGEWKIQKLHYYPRLITAYDQGWAKQASPADKPSTDFPADLPPTEDYEIYPSFFIPAFHFSHPVTQLPPQYPMGVPAENSVIGFTHTPSKNQLNLIHSMDTLTQRITASEKLMAANDAYSQSEKLVNAFSFYLDEHMWTAASQLFSKDGVNLLPNLDSASGPEDIQSSIVALYGNEGRDNEDLTLHHVVQPVIEVAEDSLSAQFTLRAWLVNANTEEEDSYVVGALQGTTIIENGKWKIQSMSMADAWAVNYLDGSQL